MKLQEDAKELRKLWGSFRQARVLFTANNLRIFDYLKSPRTVDDIAGILKTDRRATEILLDALTGLGLLKKSAGKYSNKPSSNRLLVKDSPYYQGDIIKHVDNLWHNWSGLDEIIKTGKPYHKNRDHEAFIRGMHNIAVFKAGDVINSINLKGVKTAIDIGGGPGTYSMELAKRGISVTLFDLPETVRIAKDIIKESGLKNIDFIEGDFLSDKIGSGYDLVFISQILHAYSEDDNIGLIRKSQNALNTKGKIVIQEFYIDKNRTSPVHSALFSVNMLVNTEGGRCYSPPEIEGWLAKEGFRKIKHKIIDDSVIISGIKSNYRLS
jgi:2-polyprenyl-3-methyl-5-hydroxy-6-metoxy-1,4-benzoquinol methylase